jgi:hypothetical protein
MRSRFTVCFIILLTAVVLHARARSEGDGRRLISQRLPRMIHRGGPLVREPRVVTVTFSGDDAGAVAHLEAFGAAVGTTRWWREVTNGYCEPADHCIGAGKRGRAVRLSRPLPHTMRDVDVEQLLEEAAGDGTLGELGKDDLVTTYLPPGVVLSDAFNPKYCNGGPRAFHRMLRVGAVAMPFAVVPRCADLTSATMTASHEIVEMATNPDPNAPGFRLPAGAAGVAFAAAGSEPADVCNLLNPERPRIVEHGFVFQRAWSNRGAAAGGDPCVPLVGERAYAALMPRSPVVRLAATGSSETLALDAAADRPGLKWTVSAVDLTGRQEGARYLDVQLSRTAVENGDTITLTVTRLATERRREIAIVGLVSHLSAHEHLWPLAVSLR